MQSAVEGWFKNVKKKVTGKSEGNFSGAGHKSGVRDSPPKKPAKASTSQPSAPSSVYRGTGHRLGSAPASSSPSDNSKQAAQARRPAPPEAAPGPRLGISDPPQATSTSPGPQVHAQYQPKAAYQTEEVTEDALVAVATIQSTALGVEASLTLTKVLNNVLRDPTNAKFCQLRSGNPKLAMMLSAPGVSELLHEIGFKEETRDLNGESTDYLCLSDAPARTGAIAGVLKHLQVDSPAPSVQSDGETSASAAPDVPETSTVAEALGDLTLEAPANDGGLGISPDVWKSKNEGKPIVIGGNTITEPARQELGLPHAQVLARNEASAANTLAMEAATPFPGRCTEVLLPVSTDTTLPDSFFSKTSADAKREYMQAQKRQQQEGMLMTRAMREAAASKGRKTHTYANVRIRMPEGIILQGCFEGGEDVMEVHAWIAEHLRIPLPFRLASPALPGKIKQLGRVGSVKECALVPSCLLNFQWEAKNDIKLSLSDEAMSGARVDA